MVNKEQVKSVETKTQTWKRRLYADMYIDRNLLRSEAFKKLGQARTGIAYRVYLLFLDKRVMKPYVGSKAQRSGKGKYYIENQDEIQFSYIEAEKKHGISNGTFTRAIDLLIEVGLIDIAKTGSGLHQDVTLYGISDRWKLYGTDGFIVKERPKRKARYGFTRGNRHGKNAS